MDVANAVIAKFGGQSALARLIGKAPSTVQHWTRVGHIPSKWHGPLLELARKQGISLDPADLVRPPEGLEKRVPRVPVAKWAGALPIGNGEVDIPAYVLDDGRRVISRTGATNTLTGKKGGGNLESYLNIGPLKPYLPDNLDDEMVEFSLPEIVNKTVRGLPAETFLDVCTAYVRARNDGVLTTQRQHEIAVQAGMFLAACAKVGLIALIDEATGYQYARAEDALRLKLKLFLEDEMRKWEKTYPDQLWEEFGRLTGWKGSVTQRPKYWGKLVMELVYDYLDPDVSEWLRANAPKPRHGQNYHQWLSEQYGLGKLMEHLWMLVGMAAACQSMPELKHKMAERFGRQPVQYTLFLEPPFNY